MGIINRFVKKQVKDIKGYVRTQQERRDFLNKLEKEKLKTRRESYRRESLRQARTEGRRLGRLKQKKRRNESSNCLSMKPTMDWGI